LKKLFDQIDTLCARSASPLGIITALKISAAYMPDWDVIVVKVGGEVYNLPNTNNLRWRRVWRAFLTDHVDAIARTLDAIAVGVPAEQSYAAASHPAACAQTVSNSSSKRCDHKFIDSNHCLKCGWAP